MLKLTNEVVMEYEKLVLSIVNKYASNYNREDLYQIGMNTLVSIAPKYDTASGVKFSTYAYKYILGEILKYLREDKNIHISREVISLSRKIKIATDHFYKTFGYMPTTTELSKITSIEEEKIIEVLGINQNTESLDKTYDDGLTLFDKVSSTDKVSKDDLISLKYALSELSKEDRNLIYQRYYEEKTQTEIANEMNISQVKVYRMERKILDELNSKIAA